MNIGEPLEEVNVKPKKEPFELEPIAPIHEPEPEKVLVPAR